MLDCVLLFNEHLRISFIHCGGSCLLDELVIHEIKRRIIDRISCEDGSFKIKDVHVQYLRFDSMIIVGLSIDQNHRTKIQLIDWYSGVKQLLDVKLLKTYDVIHNYALIKLFTALSFARNMDFQDAANSILNSNASDSD